MVNANHLDMHAMHVMTSRVGHGDSEPLVSHPKVNMLAGAPRHSAWITGLSPDRNRTTYQTGLIATCPAPGRRSRKNRARDRACYAGPARGRSSAGSEV